MPHLLFRKILMRNREFILFGLIDVFEINSPFIVMHNKCIINVTPNVNGMFALIHFSDTFNLTVQNISFISLISSLPFFNHLA